jgi:hypothetical protein
MMGGSRRKEHEEDLQHPSPHFILLITGNIVPLPSYPAVVL